MSKRLEGRVALVTGSARRIGRSIALSLAAEGADVMIHARSSRSEAEAVAEAARALGVRAAVTLGDVSDPAEARHVVKDTVEQLGGLDILVNNAAIRRVCSLDAMDYAEWRSILSVILDGTFLCSQAAIPYLERSGRGRIVSIGGLTSHIGAHERAHVVTAKAGIVGLTKALAVELGPRGITANCLAPGLIEAPGDDRAHTEFRRRHSPPDKIPLRRIGDPDDIGRAVAALVSDDFAYLTGQTIHLNGGVFLW